MPHPWKKSNVISTEWRKLDPDLARDPYLKEYPRRPKRIKAEYGLVQGRFRISGVVQEKTRGRWREIMSGFLFEISAHFPELEPYLVWDGFVIQEGMDYDDLRDVWNDVGEGTALIEEFKYRIRFGALEEDVMPPFGTPWAEVRGWLEARHSRLADAFRADMRALGRISGPEFRTGPGFEGPKAWFPGIGSW